MSHQVGSRTPRRDTYVLGSAISIVNDIVDEIVTCGRVLSQVTVCMEQTFF